MKTVISCIDGDLLTTGKFIYSKKEKLNFMKVEEYCTNLGLQLPMPASVAENNEAGFQNQFYDWLSISRYEILVKINEILMNKGMFLTFWLRTKNTYFNVESELTENPVFKREIKTEFVKDKDGLISGRFSHQHILCSKCTAYIDIGHMIWRLKNPYKQINLDGSKLKIIKFMELFVKLQSSRNRLFKNVKYKGNF